MGRIIPKIVIGLFLLVSASHAEFSNPDEWDNGNDLRHVRRALVGRPDVSGVVLEEVEPPTELDAPTAVLHELRAQSIMIHQGCRLLCILIGLLCCHLTFSRVRIAP
jgi:hypothetical protein